MNRKVRNLNDALSTIREAIKNVTASDRMNVYMGFDADHLTTYGKDTFMDEWIRVSGCHNAAGSIKSPGGKEGGLRSVSMEQLLAWNPDIIIIDSGRPEALYEMAAWSAITAIKERRVYRLPLGLFLWNRPACEAAVLFPLWLGCNAYPERFKSFDVKNHAMKFYREVFGFEFNESEISRIYTSQAG